MTWCARFGQQICCCGSSSGTCASGRTLSSQPHCNLGREFSLALLLFRHLGQPLSRATIHEAVWPKEAEFNSRSLDTHIARVRLKFALQPAHGYQLSPVYGYGYQLQATDFPG
ncbi:MAG: winged helix family transcriptional regulator [Oxalobacteraceae bacterium]|nr:winged helix family transcriptional regulator [Oxalobacteraceae bacterium]